MRTLYALGFIFDHTRTHVLLIQKNRPEWQKGKLNGVGGHIEKDEDGLRAFLRETQEETGLILTEENVMLLGYMQSPEWLVHVYTGVYDDEMNTLESKTDEKVAWYPIHKLPKTAISNLNWLIPLALDKLRDNSLQIASITYI